MIGTLITLVVCFGLLALSQWWWRSLLNPVSLGILAWTPALVMLNWPPYFLSPLYIQLNRPVSLYVYIAMAVALLSFWAGCSLIKSLSPTHAFDVPRRTTDIDFNPVVAMGLFSVGFLVFVYSYLSSGLADISNLDNQQIAESQYNLHLGLISFLELFMDMAAIAMFAYYIRSKKFKYLIIPIFTVICYSLTLQKSPVVWLVIAYSVSALLQPKASYELLLSTQLRKMTVATVIIGVFVGFFLMNHARGLGDVQMTGASGPVVEQLYIYSGASAIMNLSVTIDGYLPSDPALHGGYLLRPVLWHFIDRDLFSATRYFEGVNTGTYLLYGWADFRWLGFATLPFFTGAAVMLLIRVAMTGSLLGIILGATGFRAVALSVATDVIFDPLTPIILTIAVFACTAMQLAMPKAVTPMPMPRLRRPGDLNPPINRLGGRA